MNYEPRVHYFALALLITLLSVTQLAAQDRKNVAPAFKSLPTEFLIEVRKDDGCLFAPITRIERTTSLQPREFNPAVSESNKSYIAIRGSLVHTFPRPSRYQPDSFGRPIVSHVMFSAFQIGDSWKVKVAIGTGEFFDAGDQPFADFTLRTNERVEVGGLDRFGFGSFRVGVVRVNRETSEKPFVSSGAASVEVDKIEPGGGPGTYRLTLRNNSKKDILAVQYNASKNYKFLFLKWFENAQSTPLVKSGEVYKFDVATEDQQCGDADGYSLLQVSEIQIASVVFADGSYEGDSGLAALIRGQASGNKEQLERIVATLNNLSSSGEPNPAELTFHLRYLLDTWVEVAPADLVIALRDGLPASNDADIDFKLGNLIRSGQHEIKTSVRNDVQRLEGMSKNGSEERGSINGKLVIAKYQAWLAAANAISNR